MSFRQITLVIPGSHNRVTFIQIVLSIAQCWNMKIVEYD